LKATISWTGIPPEGAGRTPSSTVMRSWSIRDLGARKLCGELENTERDSIWSVIGSICKSLECPRTEAK